MSTNKNKKCCFVDGCFNTSMNSSNKKFVSVPRDDFRKQKWFEAANSKVPISKSKFYCCEDHFDFEKDMENYMKYKLMGGKIKMKPDVVPHIFSFKCKQEQKKIENISETPLLKQRKRLVEEAIADDICRSTKSRKFGISSNSAKSSIYESPDLLMKTKRSISYTSTKPNCRSIGIQTKSYYFRSKYITCNIYKKNNK